MFLKVLARGNGAFFTGEAISEVQPSQEGKRDDAESPALGIRLIQAKPQAQEITEALRRVTLEKSKTL